MIIALNFLDSTFPDARRCGRGESDHRLVRRLMLSRTERFASTLVMAASIIAAVRLARGHISRPSPRLASVVVDSIGLARMILDKVVR
jgi:hypothetical protein